MNNIIRQLIDSDDDRAYRFTKDIVFKSESTNEYYKYIDDFVSLLDNKKSYIRTRAFIIICSQAKWDVDNKIKEVLPIMSKLFYDEKPTVVRQCLNAIKEVIVYKPELNKNIKRIIDDIDISIYKESMSHLIKKNIEEINELL